MVSCRSCGARVFWATFEITGNDAPMDVDPTPDGNIVITSGDPGGKPTVRALRKGDDVDAAEPRFVSHFATCPQGRSWRKS